MRGVETRMRSAEIRVLNYLRKAKMTVRPSRNGVKFDHQTPLHRANRRNSVRNTHFYTTNHVASKIVGSSTACYTWKPSCLGSMLVYGLDSVADMHFTVDPLYIGFHRPQTHAHLVGNFLVDEA